MNPLALGAAGFVAGLLVLATPRRPEWTRSAGIAVGVAMVALAVGLSGHARRPEALAVLLGLSLPLALAHPRVGLGALLLGLTAGLAVVIASDTLLAILIFAALAASAIAAMLGHPATSSTSNE